MKKAYDYFSKIGGMYVFLGVIIVNEENDEQGIFHGQLIYTSKEGVISFRQFNSMENGRVIGVVSYRYVVSYLLPDVIYMADDIC